MHSVTLSPVNSKCTPPRCAPQSLRMWQDSSSSWRILSKRRVLIPLLVVSVFPCIGSQHQSTCLPARRSVSAIGGRHFSTKPAPKRWIRSEERRVGKECRARWWPYDKKKKNECILIAK